MCSVAFLLFFSHSFIHSFCVPAWSWAQSPIGWSIKKKSTANSSLAQTQKNPPDWVDASVFIRSVLNGLPASCLYRNAGSHWRREGNFYRQQQGLREVDLIDDAFFDRQALICLASLQPGQEHERHRCCSVGGWRRGRGWWGRGGGGHGR